MRSIIILAVTSALLAPVLCAVEPYHLTKRERLDLYRKNTVSARAAAQSAASAGIGQLRNSPHEWGQGVAGFAKRFGSSMAHRAVSSTIEFGVGAIRHEDPRYYHSGKQGFWPRTKYALVSTVLVHREGHEKRSVAVGRISGAVGGGLISRAWQPASGAALGLGVASAGISLGATAGFNMASEFWPDIHRHLHRGTPVAQR